MTIEARMSLIIIALFVVPWMFYRMYTRFLRRID